MIPAPVRLPRLLIVSLLAVLGVVGAGVAAASATPTRTRIYRPFTAAGQPAVRVTHTLHGTCFSGSAATGRADAWRCSSGNELFDPCFSSAQARGIVLCPATVSNSRAVEIKLRRRPSMGNHGRASTSGLPWAIQTTSSTCVMATGATATIHGVRANYFCPKSKNWLWGSPSRRSQPWRIYSAPLSATRLQHRVTVKVAWF